MLFLIHDLVRLTLISIYSGTTASGLLLLVYTQLSEHSKLSVQIPLDASCLLLSVCYFLYSCAFFFKLINLFFLISWRLITSQYCSGYHVPLNAYKFSEECLWVTKTALSTWSWRTWVIRSLWLWDVEIRQSRTLVLSWDELLSTVCTEWDHA